MQFKQNRRKAGGYNPATTGQGRSPGPEKGSIPPTPVAVNSDPFVDSIVAKAPGLGEKGPGRPHDLKKAETGTF